MSQEHVMTGNYTQSKMQHPFYQTWRWMIRMSNRCSICPEWENDIECFSRDIGVRPSKYHQLYRKDKESGYSKENCYWKECKPNGFDVKKNAREWRAKNPDKCKNTDLKKHFGITLDRYNEMLENQDGKCSICGKKEVSSRNGKFYSLAVDHNHKTGEIRKLLCSKCNKGLGCFDDSIEIMESAIRYLSA